MKKEKKKKIEFKLNKDTKNFLSLICNAACIILGLFCLIVFFIQGGVGNMQVERSECFKYFTVESNTLCMISCAVVLVYNLIGNGIPKWALKLKFVGCTAVGVTMIVVLAFLGPIAGYHQLFEGINVILHLILPLIAILSFIIFEGEIQRKNRFGARSKNRPISFNESFLGMIPTLAYGVMYYYFVFITERWDDLYNFNSGVMEGKWYLIYIAIIVGTFVIETVIRALHILCNKEYMIRGYTL